jgi:uncharacterized membrane protein YhaH (DUF805 family)
MGIGFSRFWRIYATFSGRASRSEYWWWVLISVIVAAIFFIIGTVAGGIFGTPTAVGPTTAAGTPTMGPGSGIYLSLSLIWGLAAFVPGLALIWRRFHDSNHSGAFYLLGLMPFVGGIIVLVFVLPPLVGLTFEARQRRKLERDVVSVDVHPLSERETMGVISLHPGVELQGEASVLDSALS